MFSDRQESDLGDVIADSLASDLKVVHDDALVSHLQALGEHLVKYLPENQFRFHFLLIDLPETNAFSLPGGRVYISRKVVALARSDDELAGVIAHELGHIVTHQMGIAMTRTFRDVLGIKEVGDRNDIYKKYLAYLDTYRRKPERQRHESEQYQYEADQVALFAMARAGYSPQAFVDFLDRLQETHGKSGSWLALMFGTTSPSQQRLRESFKNMSHLPPGCVDIRSSNDPAVFAAWQDSVISSDQNVNEESLPGLVFKQPLALPLRPDITNLRFSPDARYLLAQDEGGVHVLTREPLAPLFFIDAPDSYKAAFSPDSRSVVFFTHSLRVETWDILSQKRTAVHEVLLNQPCFQNELSPDGKYFGCLKYDLSLVLLDVASGEPLMEKRDFFVIRQAVLWYYFVLPQILAQGDFELINMHFSPDGRYFLAGARSGTAAYDLAARREADLPGSIRSVMQESFAFVGPDRVVGVNAYRQNKAPVLKFPTGQHLEDLPLNSGTHVSSVTRGDYILLWPLKESPLGVMDLNRRQLFLSFNHDAGDIYDQWVLSERRDGEVAISDVTNAKLLASVSLNQSRLGAPQAVAVSADFGRLAVASKTRGAVWDLGHNIRTHLTRSFTGAWFAPDNSLVATFPKFQEEDPAVAWLAPTGGAQSLYSVPKKAIEQLGPYLVTYQVANTNQTAEKKDCTVEITNAVTQSPVWSRHFRHEVPQFHITAANRLLLRWSLMDASGRDEIQRFPDLHDKGEKEDFLLELLDVSNNSVAGKVLVKTNRNSVEVQDTAADGDWAAAALSGGRVRVYSLATGEQKADLFGAKPAISAAAGKIALAATTSGQLDLYDLPELQVQRQYKFSGPIAYHVFSADGKRLFVLTRDQTAYVLDLNAN